MVNYQKYISTNYKWVGDIPDHWDCNRVGRTTYVKGRIGWKGLRSEDYLDEGPYLLTGTDFINGSINWSTCYRVDEERYAEDPFIIIKNDDVLITKDGSIGKVAHVREIKGPSTLNSGIFVTRPLNKKYIQRYFYWILSSTLFSQFIEYNSSGSTILHLYQNVFERFFFPLPTIPEQKLITQYLDKKTTQIDSLIEKIKNKIELLNEQKTALINQYVTQGLDPNVEMKDSGVEWIGKIPKHWIVKKIGYVANLQTGNTPSKSQEDIFFTEDKSGLPWVKPTDLNRSFRGVSSSELYLTVDGQKESRLIKKDSILICCIGNTSGKTSICNCDLSTNQQINSITFNKEVLPRYGLYYIDMFGRDLLKWMNFVTLPIISKGELSRQPIIIPPQKEQEEIYTHLDKNLSKLDLLENSELRKINLLSEYRESLISSVVTGKIQIKEDTI